MLFSLCQYTELLLLFLLAILCFLPVWGMTIHLGAAAVKLKHKKLHCFLPVFGLMCYFALLFFVMPIYQTVTFFFVTGTVFSSSFRANTLLFCAAFFLCANIPNYYTVLFASDTVFLSSFWTNTILFRAAVFLYANTPNRYCSFCCCNLIPKIFCRFP